MTGTIKLLRKLSILITCILLIILLNACAKMDTDHSAIKNEAPSSRAERVSFDTRTSHEENIHLAGVKQEDYIKIWSEEEHNCITIASFSDGIIAVAEKGNGTDNYQAEVMNCEYKDDKMIFNGTLIYDCSDCLVPGCYDNYYGPKGNLELISANPEAGKTGASLKADWEVIEMDDKKLLFEKLYE